MEIASDITLADVMGCTTDGGIFVGETEKGQLVSIRGVGSGLACGCVCPGCGRRLVAKKGSVRTHHFAHQTSEDEPCTIAGETALHKLAKEILNRELVLKLTDLTVRVEDLEENVVQERRYSFERADLEQREGEIIPDVVVHVGGRRLFVEFKVTHACDETKIARIRRLDVAAIEIELSDYRDTLISELAPAILFEAPREWLHNPRSEPALARLKHQAAERRRKHAEMVASVNALYVHALPASEPGSGRHERAVRREEFGDLINRPVAGAGCFNVPVAEWQAAIVADLSMRKPLSVIDILKKFENLEWTRPELRRLPKGLALDITRINPRFGSPYMAVWGYLDILRASEIAEADSDKLWRATRRFCRLLDKRTYRRELAGKRLGDIQTILSTLVAAIPVAEASRFCFETWSKEIIPGRGYSPLQAAAQLDPDSWWAFRQELDELARAIASQRKPGMDLMGLPFGDTSRT